MLFASGKHVESMYTSRRKELTVVFVSSVAITTETKNKHILGGPNTLTVESSMGVRGSII